MSIGSFQKLHHTFGNLEKYVLLQGCVNSQKRSKEALDTQLWLTLRLYAKRKLNLRQKYILLEHRRHFPWQSL